jgi:hypothetical protein
METNVAAAVDQLPWTEPPARRVALTGGIVSKVVMDMAGAGTHRAARVIRRRVGHVPRVGPLAATAVLAAGALAAAVPLPAAAAAQSNGIGYYVLTSNGGVHNYGAPWYGSDAYQLPAGVTAAGITGV